MGGRVDVAHKAKGSVYFRAVLGTRRPGSSVARAASLSDVRFYGVAYEGDAYDGSLVSYLQHVSRDAGLQLRLDVVQPTGLCHRGAHQSHRPFAGRPSYAGAGYAAKLVA